MNNNNKPNHKLTSNLCYLIQKNKLTSVDVAKGIDVSAELICKLRNENLCQTIYILSPGRYHTYRLNTKILDKNFKSILKRNHQYS